MDQSTLTIGNSILTFLIFLLTSGGLIYFAWKYAKKLKQYSNLDENKWLFYGKIILFAYFLGFIIFRTISTYENPFWTDNSSGFFPKLFSPLANLEQAINFLIRIILVITNVLFSEDISLFLNVYLPGLILIFLSAYSVWILIQKKRFLFFRIGVLAYLISILTLNADGFLIKPEFKVKALNLSQILEKNETLFFYPAVKYFFFDEGKLFQYAVDFKEGHFIVQNNTGKKFYLDPNRFDSNFNDGNFKGLVTRIESGHYNEKLRGELNPQTGLREFRWSPRFECLREIQSNKASNQNEEVNILNDGTCQKLLYKGKTILENTSINIVDVNISEDEKWGIFVLSHDPYDPEEVYLVQLPQ